MRTKTLVLLLFILSFSAKAQEKEKSLNKLIYISYSPISSFDKSIKGETYELGIEKKYNPSFTLVLNMKRAEGKDEKLYNETIYTKQTQLNFNGLYSPFGNEHKLDLRLGAGLSFAHINSKYFSYSVYDFPSETERQFFIKEKNNTVGGNMILSLNYSFSSFVIGTKIEHQVYITDFDLNTGIYVLTIGYKF